MRLLVHSTPPPMENPDAHICIQNSESNRSSANVPNIEGVPESKHPIVRLNMDVIADEVAARLATSLLGHVLFLKSQVPFPVAQLSRLPAAKSSARATKQRSELLQSFDTLSSHFVTTFTALSTALARRSLEPNAPKSDTKKPSDLDRWPKGRSRVFLAILVGPSTGSARSKMVLGIDGLETKVWGMIDNESGSEGPENESEDDEADDGEGEKSDDSEGGDVSGEDEEHSDEEGGEPSPPRSRSPTPDPELSYPTYQTYAERQQTLHLADRLLARTLASADAEGNSMAADMASTQTHVLLRAPRRFQHPAWIPRQNLSASMESTLDEFLEESRHPGRDTTLEKNRRGQRARVEGVWITCRDGIGEADRDKWKVGDVEDDEMIWWSWNGKLVGFSDW